jgi:hypothetical protein
VRVVESIYLFWSAVISAPSLVWTVAFMMSALVGWMIHSYLDDLLYAICTAITMYVAIVVANAGFAQIGVYFTTDREANVVAAAGASICAVTLMAVIILRIIYAVGDFNQALKREREEAAKA